MGLPPVLWFPNPVNENVARLVAAGVTLLCTAYLLTSSPVVLVLVAGGFVLRLAFGPRVSPLALLVTRVVVPRIPAPAKFVPGPPKRFAQGIGATLSVSAGMLALGFGQVGAAQLLVAAILVAATLESVFAICLGCTIFAALMRWGWIKPSVCEACSDISSRLVARL